ncbi:MAG TPA: hypothetical protein VFK74_10835 [Azospira sp.]|nr:hypothetical protein [Azospira sp.]
MRLPLLLQLHPSRHLAMLLIASHAAASGGVFILDVPLWLLVGLQGLIAGSLGWHWRCAGAQKRLAWIRLGKKGDLACGLADGSSPKVNLLPGTVWRHLVVLRYRLEQEDGSWSRARATVILSDGIEGSDSFRQLRVWMGWRARFSDDGVF